MQHDHTPRKFLIISTLIAMCAIAALVMIFESQKPGELSPLVARHPAGKMSALSPNAKPKFDFDMVIQGHASWYGHPFHGRITANGERYNMFMPTAAHKTLPFGAIVRVTNQQNGKSTYVRINDRGPYIAGRNIDLSYSAAQKLGMVDTGVSSVKLEVMMPPKRKSKRSSVIAER